MDTNTSGSTIKGWRAFAKKDWLAFDRSDYIGAKVVLGITVAGSVVFGLFAPIIDAARNAPLAVEYTTKTASGIELPRGATHDGWATAQVLLKDATMSERLTQALPAFLFAAMTITVGWLLFQLLRSTQVGEPFTSRNVMRINATALVVGIGGTLAQLAQGFADSAMYTTGRLPDAAGYSFVMTFTPLPLAVMMVIALVGEAFRRGVRLREDVDGLI